LKRLLVDVWMLKSILVKIQIELQGTVERVCNALENKYIFINRIRGIEC